MANFAQKVDGLPRGYTTKVLEKLAERKIFISPWKVYKVAGGSSYDEDIMSIILEVKMEALESKKIAIQRNRELAEKIKLLEKEINNGT
jgi:hypothetical protein